jgi:hypothetical protein
MKLGRPLRVAGAISPRLLNTLPAIQQIFRSWDGGCRLTPVEAVPRQQPESAAGANRACFFSGGVDSFYTVLKRREEISQLIFVHGFDIPLKAPQLRANVSSAIHRAAAELGKTVIEVETNLREFSDRYVSWEHYNGAALASIALILAEQFSRVYAASTHPFAAPFPWRRHITIDPLWSTEQMQFINDDGQEVPRAAKVAYIAQFDVAMRSLRVCWENRGESYNCGECEKCLRTMIALQVVGALDRCTTFVRPLDLSSVSRLAPGHNRYFIEEILDAAIRSESNPALIKALRDCLSGRYHKGLWRLRERIARRLRSMLETFSVSG